MYVRLEERTKKIENRHVFKVYFFLSGLVYLLQCLLIHDAGSSWVMKGTRNNRTIQAEASTITNTTYISLCVHTWNRMYRLKNCSMKSISFSLKKNSVLASFSCGWWKKKYFYTCLHIIFTHFSFSTLCYGRTKWSSLLVCKGNSYTHANIKNSLKYWMKWNITYFLYLSCFLSLEKVYTFILL